MSLKGLRVGFFLFFALSAWVAINLLLLQPNVRGHDRLADVRRAAKTANIETASLNRRHSTTTQQSLARAQKRTRAVARNAQRGNDNVMAALQPGQLGVRARFLPANTGNTAQLVRALQRELKSKGYDPGAEDGAAGLVTRAAIFAFEYDNRLPLTAEPSEQLLQALVLGGSGARGANQRRSYALSAEARDLVLATQRRLKQQGFWRPPVDGHFNTDLSRAIQRFETAQRLPTTGRISGRFMARLVRVSGLVPR